MPDRRFQRTREDFECLHCGRAVSGDGYTNHCPECLHSRHVDVNPGDRAADCGGLMAPLAVARKSGELRVLHRCERCGLERWNRVADEDDGDEIARLSTG